MKYRPEIDGLRALAVLAVLLFHLDLGGLPGGYVGVDIFFVISGFLITSILQRDIADGCFSIATFYERRIRRIFPALLCVCAVTSLAALVVLLPEDLSNYGRSAAAAALFVSNVFFWQQADYFDAPAEMKPLLHTWSLSVEEQFYIVLPLLLWGLARWHGGRWTRAAVLALTAASFALAAWGTQEMPVATFYLLPTRAWELLAGALLALGVVRLPSHRNAAEVAGAAGVLCIALASLLYSRTTPFPGFAALLPVGGAVLVILCSISNGQSLVRSSLAAPPLRFIGLISYSLYLWHWPLVVLAKYFVIEPLALPGKLAVLAASLLLAVLSWRYVEQPLRHRSAWTRPAVFRFAGTSIAAGVLLGLALNGTAGLPARMPQAVLEIAEPRQYLDSDRRCHGAYVRDMGVPDLCVRGAAGRSPSFLLVGDSHAGAIAGGVFAAAESAGVAGLQLSDSGYRPLPGYLKFGERDKYRRMNAQLREVLDGQPQLHTVVVVIYWHQAVKVDDYLDPQGRRIDGHDGLDRGLAALVQAYPRHRFVFLASAPASGLFGANPAARAALFGRPWLPSVARAEFQASEAPYRDLLDRLDRHANVEIHELAPLLCDARVCSGLIHGQLAYRDSNHLSQAAARALVPELTAIFDRQPGPLNPR